MRQAIRCLLIALIASRPSVHPGTRAMCIPPLRNNSSINVFLVMHLILSSILDNASVRPNSSTYTDQRKGRPQSSSSRPLARPPPVTMNYRCPAIGRTARLSISFRCLRPKDPRRWRRRGRAFGVRFFGVELCVPCMRHRSRPTSSVASLCVVAETSLRLRGA